MGNDEHIIQVSRASDGRVVQVLPDGNKVEIEDGTDWNGFIALTDAEVEANAISDPDSGWESDEELNQDRSVPFAKLVRLASGLTQGSFAHKFEIPLGTLRDWEQGVSEPDASAKTLLKVIRHHPEAVTDSLAAETGKVHAA